MNIFSLLLIFEVYYICIKMWKFMISLCNYVYIGSVKFFKIVGGVCEEGEIKLVFVFFNFV